MFIIHIKIFFVVTHVLCLAWLVNLTGKPQVKIYFRQKKQTTSRTTRIGRIIIDINDKQQIGGKSSIQPCKRKQKIEFFLRLEHYVNWRPHLKRRPYDERT